MHSIDIMRDNSFYFLQRSLGDIRLRRIFSYFTKCYALVVKQPIIVERGTE